MQILNTKLNNPFYLNHVVQNILMSKSSAKSLSKKDQMGIQEEASSHEEKINKLISDLSEEENEDLKINQDNIEEIARETEKKATKMMKTYLGEDPDSSEAIEFLAIAEGGEVIHYEVLNAISKNFKVKELSNTVHSILKEEQKHLQLCIDL